MGREVRMVPPNWQHPKYSDDHEPSYLRGRYVALYPGNRFKEQDDEWNEGYAKWQEGFVASYESGEKWRARTPADGPRYTEWNGQRPSPDDYMPVWPLEQCTHFMMYEDTSEGTPISPAFATPEELARYLADTNASAFAGHGASYEQWLSTIKRGFAVSAVRDASGMKSGVEAMAE